MDIFKKLEPRHVWDIFGEITQVPRPSKKEEKIIAWLLDFAKKHKLKAKKDEAGNVLISAPATPGMEKVKTVVLQSHVDMVAKRTTTLKLISIKILLNLWLRANGLWLPEQPWVLTTELVWPLRSHCLLILK